MSAQSGEQVKKSLETAVARVRRQMNEHVAHLQELDDKVDELVNRRGDALVDLARQYVPDVTHDTIRGTFAEIRDDLLAILARKQRRQRQLQDQATAVEQQNDQQEAELERITGALEEKVAERERLETLLAERLHGSSEFKELSKRALTAEQELERNETRVAEIQTEAKRKLPSYDKSRLFRYLHDVGYGTTSYKKKGVTRRIDGWLAKLIDFSAARRGYQFLRVTPELMANEVERRRNSFNGLMEQVEEIEDRIAEEIGLSAVMRHGQEIGAERDRLLGELAERQDELLALQEDILQLDRPDSEFHAQAVARMQNFLSNMSEGRLRQESQLTPERSDDAIVAEVVWLNNELKDVDHRSAALGQQRKAWDDRLAGLQATLQEFRRMEFDSRRSQFSSGFNITALTDQYLAGRLSRREIWSQIEQHQRFAVYLPPSRSGGPFAAPKPGDLIGGGASQVLFHVLAEVAGQALRSSAHRSMQRRESLRGRRPTISRPSAPPQRRPTPRRRGFTNGRGF